MEGKSQTRGQRKALIGAGSFRPAEQRLLACLRSDKCLPCDVLFRQQRLAIAELVTGDKADSQATAMAFFGPASNLRTVHEHEYNTGHFVPTEDSQLDLTQSTLMAKRMKFPMIVSGAEGSL